MRRARQSKAPRAALGGVVIDDGGFVRPGDIRRAERELAIVETVEDDLVR